MPIQPLRQIASMLRTSGITVKFARTRDNRLITINAERTFGLFWVTHNMNDNKELC
jgi:hypothetical protein